MACNLSEIKEAACESGIGKEQSSIKLLQLIAQLTCEASQGSGSGLPSGVILMWSGVIATIPSGWALCDGTLGTPDLRNRFVVCADADSGGSAKTTLTGAATQSGGSISHNHTVNNPTHTHSVNDPGHAHGLELSETADPGITPVMGTTVTDTSGTGISINAVATAITCVAAAAPQPYFALAYIMKT